MTIIVKPNNLRAMLEVEKGCKQHELCYGETLEGNYKIPC